MRCKFTLALSLLLQAVKLSLFGANFSISLYKIVELLRQFTQFFQQRQRLIDGLDVLFGVNEVLRGRGRLRPEYKPPPPLITSIQIHLVAWIHQAV